MQALAQAAFTEMSARQVAPMLRSKGFRGSTGTWTRTSADGDCAIVNLQKSKWNTAYEVAFTVNLSLVPKPWFEWQQNEYGLGASAKPREEHGLWRERLKPSAGLSEDGHFWLIRDAASASACGADVTAQLESTGLPRLTRLLDRDTLLGAIRAEDFGYTKMSGLMPLALVLSDYGPGAELDATIKGLGSDPKWQHWKLKDDFVTWVHERAERHRPIPGTQASSK
jgi:hypothetical protein